VPSRTLPKAGDAEDREADREAIRKSASDAPVDDKDYQVPFRFTGKLNKLTVEVGPAQLEAKEKKELDKEDRRAGLGRSVIGTDGQPQRGGCPFGFVSQAAAQKRITIFTRRALTLTLFCPAMLVE
jgi:hypothetical protein